MEAIPSAVECNVFGTVEVTWHYSSITILCGTSSCGASASCGKISTANSLGSFKVAKENSEHTSFSSVYGTCSVVGSDGERVWKQKSTLAGGIVLRIALNVKTYPKNRSVHYE